MNRLVKIGPEPPDGCRRGYLHPGYKILLLVLVFEPPVGQAISLPLPGEAASSRLRQAASAFASFSVTNQCCLIFPST